MRFAVYFGNRGFFPGELIESAIADYKKVMRKNGHEALIMEGAGTRYDAVETPEEGGLCDRRTRLPCKSLWKNIIGRWCSDSTQP